MARANKFGTFPGVFTPSLLTILGVIMYMRLGWVVGQAGLIAAVGIIIIAHIISVTTGLTISSIATDKKIKAGGIYYILSRTLGLPMGGAIGIAMFLGTALSISLYIVGFSESFLSIPAISGFLNLEPGVEGYRIVGSAVIIILVIIAFISTSLAIKSQYIILGAIFLSLISIFAGYFVHPELAPEKPLLAMASGDVSLETVFAIFFPAVTGFTAGVAMSGDLKDPKKSIPLGTIMAITTGFIVYMTLAVSFAFFVKRENLINDTNILIKIAWIPSLLIAGIWGATLSSALGGILGGPRILQALANDKVMPKIFARGYGTSNEPRNALIFIFLIAEGGILIGELNLIAGVVTMFYLASYGFINLAYILESWASTDFRPSFRVSRIFGITGFLFAFAIMFKLDVISMLAAFAIMAAIYFLLKRRQLRLDFGDVWQSVWNSIVRRGLQKLSTRAIEERNWQPNILLFSGGTEIRSYLIEFGKSLVGKFGLLSNFDLIEESSANMLFPKYKQQLLSDEESQGIFTRRQTCKDIYEGIEMIARTYGFSGIEPNTVILGWARQTRDPGRFHKLLRTINELDYNILLIDYDKRYGYGKYQKIDIWWRGEGNNGNLALTLAKLMVSSIYWENALIRLMIVNFDNDRASFIQRRADEILKGMRLEAEVKVINNQIEQKPIYDIIRIESQSADIVFAGIPEIKETDEADFVNKTNALLKEIGTVVLLKASSVFNEISLGVNREQESLTEARQSDPSVQVESGFIPSIHEKINSLLQEYSVKIKDSYRNTLNVFVLLQQESYSKFLKEFRAALSENLDALSININNVAPERITRLVGNSHQSLFHNLNNQFINFKNSNIDQSLTLLDTIIKEYDIGQKDLLDRAPEKIMIDFPIEEFSAGKNDPAGFSIYKMIRRIGKSKRRMLPVPFSFKKFYSDLHLASYRIFFESVELSGKETFTFLIGFQDFLKDLSLEYNNLRKLSADRILSSTHVNKTKLAVLSKVDEMDTLLRSQPAKISAGFINGWISEVNRSIGRTESLKSAFQYAPEKFSPGNLKAMQSSYSGIAEIYFSNITLLLNANEAENYLIQFDSLIAPGLNELLLSSETILTTEILNRIDKLNGFLGDMFESRKQKEVSIDILIPAGDILRKKISTLNNVFLRKISRILRVLPPGITIMDETSFNSFSINRLDDIKTVEVSFQQMIEFLIENKISSQLTQYSRDLYKNTGDQLNKIKDFYLSFLLSFNEFAMRKNLETESLSDFLLNQIRNISDSKKEIIQGFEKYASRISELKSEISGHLTLYGMTRLGGQIRHYIREQKELDKTSFLKNQSQALFSWMSGQAIKFKYRKTQALANARTKREEDEIPSFNNHFLEISKHIKPTTELLKKIPYYYRQLFSVQATFHKDLWVPMLKELEQANIIFTQSKHLNEGALLITGEHHSGKSFLAYILANRWNESGRIVSVNPPSGGSTDLKVFEETVAEAFQEESYDDDIFRQLPSGSFVVFDDIELWWQRTDNGLSVLNNILRIVYTFRNNIFFVLNINTHAYRLVEKLIPLNSYLLGVIKLNPVPVNSIKEMIMLRHKGAGQELEYKNKRTSELSAVKFAGLFVKIYKFSNGNPGVALAAWLGSIKKVEKNSMLIEPVETPDPGFITRFKPDSVVIMVQLLVHRQMTQKRLIEAMNTEPDSVERELQFLWRMGMVNRLHNDVYEINIYWYPVLSQYLANKNYI